MSFRLPIVDFAALSLDKQDSEVAQTDIITVGKQLVEAFGSDGFVYLMNSGFDNLKLEKATTESESFFNLPNEVKDKYTRWKDSNHGWIAMEGERLNNDRPGDLKEVFNITLAAQMFYPDQEVPGFRTASMDIISQCDQLTNRIFVSLAVGLNLEDPEFFVKVHSRKSPSMSTLRYLKYPPVLKETKPGQIRCGEHTDFGSITLLFQDDIGGLEICNSAGEWVSAMPIPGAVLVNIGDLMQRWTSDRLISSPHRVIIPEEDIGRQKSRRCMVYFVDPDGDTTISCLDGSNKYEPINTQDYLHMKIDATY